MRIAYLSTSKLPSRTANSVHVVKMCQALAGSGHDLTLYAQPGENLGDVFEFYAVANIFSVKKIKYRRLGHLGNFLFALQVLREVLRKQLPDLFYGRHLMGLVVVAVTGRPLCYEVHDVPSSNVNRLLEKALFRKQNFALLVCISAALRDEYLRLYPLLPKDKVLVAHDGADEPHPCQAAHKLKSGESGLRIGYVGHLYPGKGMEIISQMAALLPGEFFHVVGGTEHDLAYWRENSPDNVIFHGFVPHGELAPYFLSFDVVLAPLKRQISVSGGGGDIARFTSPLKLFEYMSYGKAIICSDLPVLREVLFHGENVLLCSPERIEEWLSAFRLLVADSGLRQRLSSNARHAFERSHTWSARAQNVLRAAVGERKVLDA